MARKKADTSTRPLARQAQLRDRFHLSTYVDGETHRQIEMMALEQNRTKSAWLADLVAEAIADKKRKR